jgi:hypothetical protein
MIKEIEMYTVICDGCGKDSNENAPYAAWGCKQHALDIAMEEGYYRDGDEHYCTDCHEFDDEDNLILHNKKEVTNEKTP